MRGDTGRPEAAQDDLAEDLAFFGLEPEGWADQPALTETGIWAEHELAWEAWCAVSGQWRTTALSTLEAARIVWHGLDYTAAKAGFDLAGIEVTPDLWDEVRVIEAGAIREFASVR